MLTIPAPIQTLLKSKMMVGENRPTGVLWLGKRALKDIEFFNQKRALAWRTGYDSYYYKHQVSNYVTDINGNELCAILNISTNEVYIGRMDENEDYFVKDLPVTSITPTGIIIPTDTLQKTEGKKITLHKLASGQILMLVMAKYAVGIPCTINCYISNNGLGTDFTFLSNVYTGITPTTETFSSSEHNTILSLIRASTSGDLYFTAIIDDRTYPGYIFGALATIFRSTDNGASWTQLYARSRASAGCHNVSSPCVFNNGDIMFTSLNGSSSTSFYFSTDNGVTWDMATMSLRYNNLDLVTKGIVGTEFWEADTYYDYASDTLYRWMPMPKCVAVMYSPTVDRILANNQFDDIWWILNTKYADPQHVECPLMGFGTTYWGYLDKNLNGNWLLEDSITQDMVLGIRFSEKRIIPKAITIDRSKGSASQATIVLDNKWGIYSPDNAESEWAGEIWPNKEILVTLGYGAEQQAVFTGYIDEVNMSNYPAELTITARDKSKLALDQTITVTNEVGITSHTTMFINETPEYIFSYLAVIAGYNLDFIFTEVSGIVIEEITFSQESYADAFQRLAETAGFEWLCDENGNLFFRKAVEAEPVSGWTFSEGEDIFSLGYTISDAEVYRNIEVIAQDADGTTIYSDNVWPAADYYGLPINKTLIIQATDLASNLEQCAALANQAAVNLSSKPRRVEFVVVGHPYLQIGDCVTVIESSSTISEIYRIWSLTHNMNANGSPVYTTSIKCYWYASGGV